LCCWVFPCDAHHVGVDIVLRSGASHETRMSLCVLVCFFQFVCFARSRMPGRHGRNNACALSFLCARAFADSVESGVKKVVKLAAVAKSVWGLFSRT
jgi:hypothetical protein